MKTILKSNELLTKLENKAAVIGIIGLGYVGLPNVVSKAKAGYTVIGFDLDETKVESINNGVSYIGDVSSFELHGLVNQGVILATTDFTQLGLADVIVICVPTPIDEFKQPDLSYVKSAVDVIAENMSANTLVMLESTTYPGTTEEIIVARMQEEGRIIGEDVYVAYSPERIDPSNINFNVDNTPRVVGGHTNECLRVAVEYVGHSVTPVSSTKVAEMAKVYENTFRFVNIALANELSLISDKMGIDVWEVIKASSTKPFGFMPFYPSAGVGGHCIPVDPYYLSYKAKQFDYQAKMIEVAGELDSKMREHTINKMIRILNNQGKSIKNARIAIMGVTYKKDVADVRESAIYKIINDFEKYEPSITLVDPYVKELKTKSKKYDVEQVCDYDKLGEFDLVVLLTDHSSFDYVAIYQNSTLIFDTKNAYNLAELEGQYYKL